MTMRLVFRVSCVVFRQLSLLYVSKVRSANTKHQTLIPFVPVLEQIRLAKLAEVNVSS
jgi:hypothetical protein